MTKFSAVNVCGPLNYVAIQFFVPTTDRQTDETFPYQLLEPAHLHNIRL